MSHPAPIHTTPAVRTRYESATAAIQAWVIITQGENGPQTVGRIVIRRRATSQGHTVRAWAHVFGMPMYEGRANGGGYDMASAALENCFRRMFAKPMDVPIRARLAPVAAALEASWGLDRALANVAGDWFIVRAI